MRSKPSPHLFFVPAARPAKSPCSLPTRPRCAIFSPTHKQTEGGAQCGALSLLQKTPQYRGDPAETAARLNVKLCVLVVTDWWDLTACSRPVLLTRKLKADTEIKSRREADLWRVIRGCWLVLLFFAPCCPLPRSRRPLPPSAA